jgi:pimeloyl-ACP methyl ester carboxylesterase
MSDEGRVSRRPCSPPYAGPPARPSSLVSDPSVARFLAYRRSVPRPRLDDAALSVPDPVTRSAHTGAVYRAWFANRELAELFAPPRSDSLTGAAIAACLRRNGYDWRPALRALSIPTLVLHGTEDALPTGVAKELAGLLPKARLTLIPGSGHMPFWEMPEAFFAAVDSFLLARTLGPAAALTL